MLAAIAAAAFLMTPTKPMIDQSWTKTLVVGHRGAAAYEPENTIPSFKKAIEAGVSATECDVWMSKDGVPFIMHDATLDRTTDLTGRVDAFTADQLSTAGIPTLEEVMAVTKNKIVFVIEVKGGKDVEPAVVSLVKKHKMEKQVVIFSFNKEIVANVKKLNPALYAVWLSGAKFAPEKYGEMIETLKAIKADAIGFSYNNVEAPVAPYLRERKIPLFVWTVPPGAEVDRLKGLNVNFIITNHPQDVKKQLGL